MSQNPPNTDVAVDLPSPPFINVTGIFNFRDLGGYPVGAAENHSFRTGVVYRCGDPSQITKDGIVTLQELGITHIYDLRSNNEIERNLSAGRGGVVEWEGCERVFVPVFKDQDYSPEKLAIRYKDYASGIEGFTRAYTDILKAAAPTSYRTIFLHLANEPSKPLIIHCTAGKDRTGVVCALILSLCGVDDDTVAYEYSLTEVGLPTERKQGVIKHLMENPALKGNMEGAMNMIGAKAVYMLATLRVIREQFGSVENYVIEHCGLTKKDIENIRFNLVVREPALDQTIKHIL